MARGTTGTLRIIGGRFRGRRLVTPAGLSTRPPLGQQREAVFNMLGDRVIDAAVADLFAGSGSFGLEACSRGARTVAFVEEERSALAALATNLAALGLEQTETARVIRGNALRPDRWIEKLDEALDIVFMDPPFAFVTGPEGGPALARLLAEITRVLNPGGLVLIRLPVGAPAPPGTTLWQARTMGRSVVHFYRRVKDP
jgi:16S rRNA (guanine966-N2)-methyltransferase